MAKKSAVTPPSVKFIPVPSSANWEKYIPYLFPALMGIIAFFIFKDYLLRKNIYLFLDIGSDSVNFNYVHWQHYVELARKGGNTAWSFQQGMGQTYLPVGPGITYGLMGPLIFLAGNISAEQFPYLIIWFEVIKMLGGGFFFYLFLKSRGCNELTSCCGGLFFAFSGYMVLGSGWSGLSMEAFHVAFLLFAVEELIQLRSWWWFPLAMAVLIILSPFLLLPWGIFMIIYTLFRFYEIYGISLPRLGKLSGLAIVTILLGGAMALFMGEVLLNVMLESPRGGGASSYAKTLSSFQTFNLYPAIHNLTALYRLFSSDLVGGGLNFRGWNNYLEAPIFYIGLLPLLLLGLSFQPPKNKRVSLHLIFFLLFLFPVVYPYFRFAYWGFTGDYYRTYSLVFALAVLIGAMSALDNLLKSGKVPLIYLAVTTGILLLLLYYPFSLTKQLVDQQLRNMITMFIIGGAAWLALYPYLGKQIWFKPILLGLIVIELVYMGQLTANKRDMVKAKDLKEKKGYNDYSVEAIDWIKQRDNGFYRIAKDYFSGPAYHGSLNDGIIQGYNGTSCYYSFNQKYYISFLTSVGQVEDTNEFATRWAQGINNRPLLMSLVAGKYTLHKGDNPYLYGFGYDSLTAFSDVKVFRNRFSLPFGVVYHQWIDSISFARLSPFVKDKTLLKAVVLSDEKLSKGLTQLAPGDTAGDFTFEQYQQMIDTLKHDTVSWTVWGEDHWEGNINLEKEGMLFLPMPWDRGWSAEINGEITPINIVDNGLCGIYLKPGKNEIKLQFSIPSYARNLMISYSAFGVYALLLGFMLYRQRKIKPASDVVIPS